MLLPMAKLHSFLWLNNIPLCIYYIFFTHSSVDGHLGCFHILPIVNSAVMNIGLLVSFQVIVFIFLDYLWQAWSFTCGMRMLSCGIRDLVPYLGLNPGPLHWGLPPTREVSDNLVMMHLGVKSLWAHLVWDSVLPVSHWRRPWCWERLRAGGEGNDRGWGGWMASLTWWTWTWASSRRQWRMEEPDMLQSVKESDTTEQEKHYIDQFLFVKNVLKWVLVAQLCLTLFDPMDCSPPGSSVHEIFQARILEWVAISFSRGSSGPRNWTRVSCTAGRFFTN